MKAGGHTQHMEKYMKLYASYVIIACKSDNNRDRPPPAQSLPNYQHYHNHVALYTSDRHRQTHRQTDRQPDCLYVCGRQAEGQTNRHTYRETERQTDTERQTERQQRLLLQ